MKSFDVFDTLIARKCISPQGIFSLVEQRLGRPGFAQERSAAEQALHGSEYTFADIHAELVRRGLPQDVAERARQLELDAELENVMPIVAQLAQVNDGDLLVSDTYHDEDFIRQLLARAGLKRQVALLRSADGKATGRLWAAAAQAGIGLQHLGDHPVSDGEMARRHGVAATLSTPAQPTQVEQWLLQQGFTGTALLIRAVRLGLQRHADPQTQALVDLQVQVNLPIMLIAALHLRQRIHAWGDVDRVLFCSRDCRHLERIYRRLPIAEGAQWPPAVYFYTSRIARVAASDEYRRYFAALATPRTLVVDLCGTGLSLARLYRATGIAPRTFLLFGMDAQHEMTRLYRQTYAGDLPVDAVSLLGAQDGIGNVGLEMLNGATHGMVKDVARLPGFDPFLPQLAPCEYGPAEQAWLAAMEQAVDLLIERLGDPLLAWQLHGQDAQRPADAARAALIPIWRIADQSQPLFAAFANTHLRDNQNILAQLSSS